MRNLSKLIFRRFVIVSLLLLLQLSIIFLIVFRFAAYLPWYSAAASVAAAILTLVLVSREGDPAYKIAWIIPILTLPVFGVTLYLIFGGGRPNRREKRQLRKIDKAMRDNLRQNNAILQQMAIESPDSAKLALYLCQHARCPVYADTDTMYFPNGERYWQALLEDLREAKHYIFLEFFIIEPGKMWDAILSILKERAAAGVDVRVMYDDFGCITRLPFRYQKQLRAFGIACKPFNPFVPLITPRLNNRDHRKILTIDGRISYTGGVNLADEYINEIHPFGHWKDCGLRLEGDGAWSLAVMFLSMWNSMGKDPIQELLPVAGEWVQASGYVQPYADSPLQHEAVSETAFVNLISHAKKSVYIMTPYLILDSAMRTMLCVAAKSGIDVRVITPGRPDKKYVYAVTRANYRELLDAGVRIYEYKPGFLHSKVILVDNETAVVGTVNMDFRSLYLHYEDAVFLYGTTSVQQLQDDFTDTLPVCREVDPEVYRKRPIYVRALESVLRMFAPLM